VVYFHHGGFYAGDKSLLDARFLKRCLQAKLSVAAVDYRLSGDAPFPAAMHDSARAIQCLRLHAREWNLDPDGVAATGHGVGGGISLWLALHADLADPDSPDPVARQCTRLAAAVVVDAQTSYDPRFMREHIGGRAHEHPQKLPFFGLRAEEADSPRAYRLYEEASPFHHASADDPPLYLYYRFPDRPLPAGQGIPGHGIHHPRFGKVLARRLEELGVPCILKLRPNAAYDVLVPDLVAPPILTEMIAFLRRRLVSERGDR